MLQVVKQNKAKTIARQRGRQPGMQRQRQLDGQREGEGAVIHGAQTEREGGWGESPRETETGRETDRQIKRQRQTDRETGAERDKQTVTKTKTERGTETKEHTQTDRKPQELCTLKPFMSCAIDHENRIGVRETIRQCRQSENFKSSESTCAV